MPLARTSPQDYFYKKTTLFIIIIASVGAFLTVGCGGNSPSQPTPTYSLRAIELDSLWILGSPQFDRVIVQAYPSEWSAGRTIRCIIDGEDVLTHFYLYDDGSLESHFDGIGFCDSISGDVAAGDGKFTRRIRSLFTSREGEFTLAFAFQDHPAGVDTFYARISVVENSPPAFIWLSFPDSIPSGSPSPVFRAKVGDPDGSDDISRVALGRSAVPRGSTPLNSYEMVTVSDTTFEWQFLPEVAAGYPTGFHSFFARASDHAMQVRDAYTFSDTLPVWIENAPPAIDSISAPDTVWVSGAITDSTKFYIDIFARDDQTPLDLDSLLLQVSRFDSTSGHDIVTFSGYYFDNNRGNDTLTAAGVIRTGWSATRANRLATPFTFTWTITDRSPQRGETRSNSMVIMLVGNGSPKRDEIAHDKFLKSTIDPFG